MNPELNSNHLADPDFKENFPEEFIALHSLHPSDITDTIEESELKPTRTVELLQSIENEKAIETFSQLSQLHQQDFLVSCWAIVFGMIGLFLRFAKRRVRILHSLSENSYGIYIVHYVFVTWLQYLMLGSGLAPLMKGIVVFLGACPRIAIFLQIEAF